MNCLRSTPETLGLVVVAQLARRVAVSTRMASSDFFMIRSRADGVVYGVGLRKL